MTETPALRVLRRSRGRLRVHVPTLLDDDHGLARIEATEGVLSVHHSERTGNMLIEFDETLIDEPDMLTAIAGSSPSAEHAQAPEQGSGWLRGARSETLAAAVADCLATLLEFERYPEWQAYVASVRVIERDRRGRGIRVLTHGKLGAREVHFTTSYRFPTPNSIAFEQEDGELDRVRGHWAFRSVGRGRTRATCELAVKPGWRLGLMLRGHLLEQAREAVLDHVMNELRERVENEPAAAAGRSAA